MRNGQRANGPVVDKAAGVLPMDQPEKFLEYNEGRHPAAELMLVLLAAITSGIGGRRGTSSGGEQGTGTGRGAQGTWHP